MPSSRDNTPAKETLLVWAVCSLLLLAVAVVYGQSLGHVLLDYDDTTFVTTNLHVNRGLTSEGVHWALTSGPFGEWYPLSMLSHMLDCQLFGLKPWGHHLTSVLLHAATSIALFLVLRSMTGELWPSAFVAAVFAVHPQHVESVAWVSERKDVLSGLLFVLTLAAYLGYTRHGRSLGWYLLLAVTFALGLLAKPMLVTVPPLLLLLDYWPLARLGMPSDRPGWTDALPRPSLLRLLLEKLPLLALAVGDSLITLRTHASSGVTMPLEVRLGNGIMACVAYIVQFFNPVGLAAFYPSPPGGPAMWKVASAGTIVLAVSVAALVWRRRCPYLYVGWFWYLGMLFPTLGFFTVAWYSKADRYMYLPGIGLYLLLAWGATRLATGFAAARLPLAISGAAAVVALTACAVNQTSYWRNEETLWAHDLSCTSDNGRAELEFSKALMQRGELDQALPLFRRAIEHPLDYHPFMYLGLCLARLNQADEALKMLRRAVEIHPEAIDAQCALALTLTMANQFEEANQHFKSALQIDPEDVNAHCGYALLLRRMGKLDEARVELERALAIDPQKAPAQIDLASLLIKQGQIDAAIPHFQAALAIDPKQLRAQIGLARALAARGRITEAADHYRQALAIDPDNAAARDELAKLER